VFSCISDSGQIQGTDKWVWSQFRFVWVFAKLALDCHPSDQNKKKWLDAATKAADFMIAHGWSQEDKGWVLVLS
jgi:mannose/cellobiose epimerase-like protein (N-acyl-D-glucosamine 2-epimerase family)